MKLHSRKKNRKTTKRNPPRRNDAVARMNTALLAEFGEIKTLVADADRQDAQARYKIAVCCEKVRQGEGHGGEYGFRAATKLAQALGWSKSSVYEYANVARTWPDQKEFNKVLSENDRFEKPLTWSHIVLLATVADVEHRSKLIADALQVGWNVRELRKKMRTGALGEHEAISNESSHQAAPRALTATVEDYVAQVAALRRTAAVFGTYVIDKIKQNDQTALAPILMERLTEARQNLSDLLKQFDEWMEQIPKGQSGAIRPQDDWECNLAGRPQEGLDREHVVQPQKSAVVAL